MKRLKNKKILIVLIVLCIFSSLAFLKFTKSSKLDNDVEVEPNSELTYYLEVTYDGVDKYGIESSDETTARVYSDYIYVEDRIPEGLTFERFLTSSTGVIGAVRRDDETLACTGSIVDDTGNANETDDEITLHGLHYNKNTKTVTFKVSGMQAGCKLVVGIVTRTPTIRSGERIDFYNSAVAREEWQIVTSNIVHAYMGGEATRYKVTYEYTGNVPEKTPTLPTTLEYAKGVSINVLNEPLVEGYKFSGWTTTDVEVTDGVFTMPEKTVKFTGTFEELPKYKVTYNIAGKPNGYIEPLEKEYYPNSIVELDSLSVGDVFNGYEFLGWTIDGIEIIDNTFVMPESDVIITGKFNVKKYKVEYQFIGDILPDNSELLLPAVKEYVPNEIVTLDTVNDVEGYYFEGWQLEDNFEMPEEDVLVLGSWIRQNGTFEPDIKIEIVDNKNYYKKGDVVKYKITVSNNADYPIKDITVLENNINAKFISSSDYTLDTNRMVTIDNISAHGSAIIYAEYEVTDNDTGIVNNEVEIISASADNYYNLNPDKNYKASISFNIYAKLNICNTIDKVTNSTYEYHITSSDYDTWINVEANNCRSIYLKNEEYKIRELVPQDNEVDNEIKTITVSGNGEITFNNKYKKKGFYKSNGEVKNIVEPICDGVFPLTGECAFLDSKASEFVTSATGIDFGQISSDTNGKGLYIRNGTENDEYPIYYYRGAVTNNNIIYAGFCWKIVRTTETGGIKLIYNGEVGTGNTCNNTDTASQIGTSAFNSTTNNAKYVGYMYDTSTSSTIKTYIDNWYKTNMLNKYDSYLEDTIWCNDRSVVSTSGSTTYYGAYGRLFTNKSPSLTCSQQVDKYTLKSTSKNYNASLNGNKLLDYPIALLTADEVSFAGVVFGLSNSAYYLSSKQDFWLLSPYAWNSSTSKAYVTAVDSYGYLGYGAVSSYGVRPAVSLRSGTSVTTARNAGDAGSAENPYIVK